MSACPRIGITCDGDAERYFSRRPYADAIARCGATPLLLAHHCDLVDDLIECCDALLLTGGDDPRTEMWGVPTHAAATPVHPTRQAFDVAIIAALARRPDMPVLGICLGMQFMALCAGGTLDQHLPDGCATHAMHWNRSLHPVRVDLGHGVLEGTVLSHHRQAVRDPGAMLVVGNAEDGVIEAIRDPARPFYLGVQWHPERTDDPRLGAGVLQALVDAAMLRARARTA